MSVDITIAIHQMTLQFTLLYKLTNHVTRYGTVVLEQQAPGGSDT